MCNSLDEKSYAICMAENLDITLIVNAIHCSDTRMDRSGMLTLTHCGLVITYGVMNIASDNGLLPVRCQPITWTNHLLSVEQQTSVSLKYNTNIFLWENMFWNTICKTVAIEAWRWTH